MRIAFDLLDRNQDGRVTAGELQFMLKNLGIVVRDELIDDLIKEASHGGNKQTIKNFYGKKKQTIKCIKSFNNIYTFANHLGNGLMDEKEFRQWIQRIQSLQEDTVNPSTSQTDTDDDLTQDLIAAFR